MIFTRQPSPMVRDAARIYLPACEDTADQIIRDIIEGRPDATRSTKSNVTGYPSDPSPAKAVVLLPDGLRHPYPKPAVSDAHHNCAHSNA